MSRPRKQRTPDEAEAARLAEIAFLTRQQARDDASTQVVATCAMQALAGEGRPEGDLLDWAYEAAGYRRVAA